jgi:hypothetical protein
LQGVLELMETINIVRVEGKEPKTAREAEFSAKLALLAGLGGMAAGRVAGAAEDAADVIGGAADAAAAAGQAVLDSTSAVFRCVSTLGVAPSTAQIQGIGCSTSLSACILRTKAVHSGAWLLCLVSLSSEDEWRLCRCNRQMALWTIRRQRLSIGCAP